MNRQTKLMGAGVALIAVLGGGYLAADRVYLAPRAQILDDIASVRRDIASYTDTLERLARPADLRAVLGETTLGNTPEEVSHQLRTLLSNVGEASGLTSVVVTHGRPSAVSSPAADRASRLNRVVRRAIDEAPTFAVISARVQGVGSYEATLATIAALDSQPWVHRFEGFQIEPANRDRSAFEVRADITTAFMAGLRRVTAPPPSIAGTDSERAARVAALATANVFVPPPRPPKPAPPPDKPKPKPKPKPAPEPPPPPPYHEWVVVGVIETTGSTAPPEVLVRRAGGETRMIRPGERVLDAELVSASGEAAVFTIDGKTYEIVVGATLADRREMEPDTTHSESGTQ